MTGTTRSVFCGLSSDGRLCVFFDWPLAWQLGNGVRWWWRHGLYFFWRVLITIVI